MKNRFLNVGVNISFQPLMCRLGKHQTLYSYIEHEYGVTGPVRDECTCCGKEYVWIYLGRADKKFDKCEVLNEQE